MDREVRLQLPNGTTICLAKVANRGFVEILSSGDDTLVTMSFNKDGLEQLINELVELKIKLND